MRRSILLGVTLSGALAACTEGGKSLIILQNQVPTGCVPPAGTGATFRPRGRIDVASAQGYLFFPLVQNLSSSEDNNATHIVQVQGADIDIAVQEGFFADGEITEDIQRLLSFSQRFSGVVMPDAGLSAFSFEIIPQDLLEAIKETGRLETDGRNSVALLVTVKMFGTMDGGDIESAPYDYVVDVCDGCLLRVVNECADLPDGFVASQGGECNPLQDEVLDCCTEADGDLLCPATPL